MCLGAKLYIYICRAFVGSRYPLVSTQIMLWFVRDFSLPQKVVLHMPSSFAGFSRLLNSDFHWQGVAYSCKSGLMISKEIFRCFLWVRDVAYIARFSKSLNFFFNFFFFKPTNPKRKTNSPTLLPPLFPFVNSFFNQQKNPLSSL